MTEPKLVLSTAILGQLAPSQWRRVVEDVEREMATGDTRVPIGLEVVAAVREPLLSLLVRQIKQAGLVEKVVTVHGRVDYDLSAFGGRMRGLPMRKRAKVLFFDLFMAWVGEAYRATLKLPKAKLLLHAPTLFQLAAKEGPKPKMFRRRLVVENDEMITFPFGSRELALEMQRWGNPLNPVDVFAFAQEMGLSKMVFDTAHFWRSYPNEKGREWLWRLFVQKARKSALPIYWHMNHTNGRHFLVRKNRGGFVSKHDEWLAGILKFVGPRVRHGKDQICLEEPVKLRLRMRRAEREGVTERVIESIENLREYGGL